MLRKYLYITQTDGMDSCHGSLDKIESYIHNYRIKNLKQEKITDYLLYDWFHVILVNKKSSFHTFLQEFFELGS
jgi:hypothetical protein